MKKSFLLLLLGLCLCAGCAIFRPGDAALDLANKHGGTPAIQLAENEHDFGIVKEDGDYLHSFGFRNTGTGLLVIQKVIPA